MHPESKSDKSLGRQVHEHLVKEGLETPMKIFRHDSNVNEEEREYVIEVHFKGIMDALGLDMADDSLCDTPRRVARMFNREIYWGLDYSKFPKCTAIKDKMSKSASFVHEHNVNIMSNCEHHFVVIDGFADIAYIPNGTLLGLSKLNRIAEFFSKRPQVQERLTEQIAETIKFITKSNDVAVAITAEHYCVKSRGIQDTNSTTSTLATRGAFSEFGSPQRVEFLNSIVKGV